MTTDIEGTSDLARLAQQLPARGRVGLAVVMACLALNRLRGLPDYSLARHAFELTRRWFDGERFDPDRFEDTLQDDDNEGIDKRMFFAQSSHERATWVMLGNAVAYTAFHAYQAIGKCPGPLAGEIDESNLDDIDKELRAVSPHFIRIVAQAAECLEEDPAISFAQLRAKLSRDFPGDMGAHGKGSTKSTGEG
jgi:hypothetical protein